LTQSPWIRACRSIEQALLALSVCSEFNDLVVMVSTS
jgi:hypothetical protein